MSKREWAFELLSWACVAGLLVLVAMAALYIVFVSDHVSERRRR